MIKVMNKQEIEKWFKGYFNFDIEYVKWVPDDRERTHQAGESGLCECMWCTAHILSNAYDELYR